MEKDKLIEPRVIKTYKCPICEFESGNYRVAKKHVNMPVYDLELPKGLVIKQSGHGRPIDIIYKKGHYTMSEKIEQNHGVIYSIQHFYYDGRDRRHSMSSIDTKTLRDRLKEGKSRILTKKEFEELKSEFWRSRGGEIRKYLELLKELVGI